MNIGNILLMTGEFIGTIYNFLSQALVVNVPIFNCQLWQLLGATGIIGLLIGIIISILK